jgi:copper chaperone NosL
MVMDLNKKETVDYTTILVANFSTPGEMIDATHAIYIISPEIKSPMGANLSAVDTQEKALELHNEHTGELYSWTELIAKFKE